MLYMHLLKELVMSTNKRSKTDMNISKKYNEWKFMRSISKNFFEIRKEVDIMSLIRKKYVSHHYISISLMPKSNILEDLKNDKLIIHGYFIRTAMSGKIKDMDEIVYVIKNEYKEKVRNIIDSEILSSENEGQEKKKLRKYIKAYTE